MGVLGLWPFLRKKGYDPFIHCLPNSFARVDILGTFFSTIRYAYTSHNLERAHLILEREIDKYFDRKSSSLYLDGLPCVEKITTLIHREEIRAKALDNAEKFISILDQKVDENLRVRKWLFSTIHKYLRNSFYWTLDARKSFEIYMRNKGWAITICSTEADLAIALDCVPTDIVVSRDSDMLIYESVHTIWRPISKGRFLVYDLPKVLEALGINRVQLTLLGVVSKNDYSNNIHGLGAESNFGIIKRLKGEGKKQYRRAFSILILN